MADEQRKHIEAAIKRAEADLQLVQEPSLRSVAFPALLAFELGEHSGSAPKVPVTGHPVQRAVRKRQIEPGKRAGPVDWVLELNDEGFFDEGRTMRDILSKLAERGHHLRDTDLTRQLQGLVARRILRRHKKRRNEGEAEVWHYVRW